MCTIYTIISEIEHVGAPITQRSSSSQTSRVFEGRWRVYHSTSPKVYSNVWMLLDVSKKHLEHLLWVALFLKLHPKENLEYLIVSGIYEKTWRNNFWPLLEAITSLENEVVHKYLFSNYKCYFILSNFYYIFFLTIIVYMIRAMITLYWWMGRIFQFRRVESAGSTASLKILELDMRLVLAL